MAKLGGWDVINADARQWNVAVGAPAVASISNWGSLAAVPYLGQAFYGLKDFSVTFLVKTDGGRQELRRRCSMITAHALKPCEIELDGFDNRFFGVLKSADPQEMSMRHWHVLTLTFSGYEYGREATVRRNRTASFPLNNAGNIITPVRIEITPVVTVASMTLTGLCVDQSGEDHNIVIANATQNSLIVLDGETGLFTQDGQNKVSDLTIWGLPAILPGDNQITVGTANANVTIKYKPRYL